MKKWIIMFVISFALFVSPYKSEASTNFKVMKAASELDVKSEAQQDASMVTQLSKGSLVIVYEEQNEFSKISYHDRNGYVVTNGLLNASTTPKAVTRKQGLAVKATPSSSAKTVTTLQAKTIVEDFGQVNANYHLIQYGSVVGYAHKSTIQATKPTTRYIVGDSVAIYSSANTKGEKRNTLAFGEAVKVYGTIGNWSYITVGNKSGYMSKSFLASKKPAQLKGAKMKYADIKNDIRFTTTLRDLKGNSVQVHFVASPDYFKYATLDDIWAGVNEGDALYIGDYKLALQLKGSSDVYLQTPTFNSYTYNKTRKMVYSIKGKTAKDTDFIAVAETWSSAGEGAQLYFYQNGMLKSAGETGYILRPKSLGNQRYQSASYARDEVVGYIFYTESFNPSTGQWKVIKKYPFFDDLWDVGSAHATKFLKYSNYYVK